MDILKKFKFLATLILPIFFTNAVLAQAQNFSLTDNLNPVTPTAFQFTKYTELPVSEYTGIPNISIPLYEIDEDGVKIPLDLTYHAGGIRVNEEASWVGLGWDLQIGSIVQEINDQEDYATATKSQPDFFNTSMPIVFPYKYEYCTVTKSCNYGCTGPIQVISPNYNEGYVIYTNDVAPFNGVYNSSDMAFFESHSSSHIDSEPDIFIANFAGYSFKFVLDWNTGNWVVLDKKGFSITRTPTEFKILVPSGEEYDFAVENIVQTESASTNGASSSWQPSSIVWFLTQIITKNKKVITFNYNVPSQTYNVYPSFTEKGLAATLQTTYQTSNEDAILSACTQGVLAASGGYTNPSNLATVVYPLEKYVTLSSITFPKGTINFSTDASRNDLNGGYKLDAISISANQQVKSYTFNYGYFNATGVTGPTYSLGNYGNYPFYRLQLLSIQDNSGATHTFSYNTTQLPPKNSFAIDYWGFYNGQTSNTTAIPNASQFVNSSQNINMASWGNNNDNHSANVTYAQACMLQQIKYPSGGSVNFNYELNQFSNYWVPDFANSNNTISSGDGLRVKAITFQDINNTQLKKTNYTYAGGLAILPLNIFRTYNYNSCPLETFK